MLNPSSNKKCKNCDYCYITILPFDKDLGYYCTWNVLITEEDDYCEDFKIKNDKKPHIDIKIAP